MQFRVPQFIETEDKVVGPFSLRQFGYIAAAAATSLILYFTVQTWLWFIGTVIIGVAGIAFAFLKVNGRPLPRLVLASLSFYWRPQTYLWRTGGAEQQEERGRDRFSIEHIVSGLALKRAWRYLQTGGAVKEEKGVERKQKKPGKERYQLFHRPTGEHRVAKRVDYV